MTKPEKAPSQMSTILSTHLFINVKQAHLLIMNWNLIRWLNKSREWQKNRKIEKDISIHFNKAPRISISLCLTPVGKMFYARSKDFSFKQF